MRLCEVGARFFLILSTLCVAACASTVKTRVNTFSAPAASAARGTLTVQPAREELKPSLEFALYREKVETALRALGYAPVADSAAAEFVAILDYGVDAAPSSDRDAYVSGGWGYGRSRYYGSSVMIVNEVDRDEFLRHVSLMIERNQPEGERIYEVKGASEGQCGVLSVVFDEMLSAILQDFPSANATVKTVSVRGDTRC
jgi:hypothetical protein